VHRRAYMCSPVHTDMPGWDFLNVKTLYIPPPPPNKDIGAIWTDLFTFRFILKL
jgi:hypothetical protein